MPLRVGLAWAFVDGKLVGDSEALQAFLDKNSRQTSNARAQKSNARAG